MPDQDPVTLADVEAAAARIAGAVVRTPCNHSMTLSAICGTDIWVKFENLQYTASFKDRGARNRLVQLTVEERARGVIAMSAGNHAQALANQARLLGISATVVMPRTTPFTKVTRTELLGATVVLAGDSLAEARAAAAEIAAAEDRVFIPPYDDARVVAGQGTVALEMLDDVPQLDTIVVPTGGGGLLGGIALTAKARRPDMTIIGVQSERYASMAHTLAGEPDHPGGPTIAEGIAVVQQGDITLPLCRRHVDRVVTVPEARIEEAVSMFLDIEKTVAEGAGAAGLAAVLEHPQLFRDRCVGLVLSGGNIDLRVLSKVLVRALARGGQLTHITVVIDDGPGSLSRMTGLIGELRGSIVDVMHRRDRPGVAITDTEVELTIETRDAKHAAEIADSLRAAGYPVAVEAD